MGLNSALIITLILTYIDQNEKLGYPVNGMIIFNSPTQNWRLVDSCQWGLNCMFGQHETLDRYLYVTTWLAYTRDVGSQSDLVSYHG